MESNRLTNELYNSKTLYTLGGASLGVWLFTIVIGNVFNLDMSNYKWLGLIIAIFLSFVGAFQVFEKSLSFYTIVFFNGLLIYVTASGIDSINHSGNLNKSKQRQASFLPFSNNKIWWVASEYKDSIASLKDVAKSNSELIDRYTITIKLLKDSLLKTSMHANHVVAVVPTNKSTNLYDDQVLLNQQLKDSLSFYKNRLNEKGGLKNNLKGVNISDDNISNLKSTISVCNDILEKLQNFKVAGRYNPATRNYVYLQKDIYFLESHLQSDISQINLILNSVKKDQ